MPQQGIMATVLATATPARLAAAKMALSTSGTQTYGTARYTGSSLYGPAPPPSVTRTVLSPAERAGLVFDPSTLALQRQEARSPAMRRAVISMYGKAYPERPGVIMPDMPELDRMRLRSPETQRRVERLHYPERAVDFLQTLAPAGTRQDERVVGVLVGRQGLRGVLLRRDEPMPREPFLGASEARAPSGDRLLDAISAIRGGVSRGYGESKTMRLAGKAYFERGTELVRRGATPLDRAMGSLYRVRGFSQMALGKLGEVGAGSVALAPFPEQTAASLWKMLRHPVATGKELVTEVRRDPTTAIDVYFQGQLLGRAGGALYRRSPVKLRLESLKVPSGKGELMRQWTGVSAEVGQRGYPLVGFGRPRTMGGTGIFKRGTPSIRAEAVDLSQGWTVSSPGQTAIFTRALKGLTSPVEQAKFGKTLAMMRATERTPSAFTAKAFSRELGSLSPRGAGVGLGFAHAGEGAAPPRAARRRWGPALREGGAGRRRRALRQQGAAGAGPAGALAAVQAGQATGGHRHPAAGQRPGGGSGGGQAHARAREGGRARADIQGDPHADRVAHPRRVEACRGHPQPGPGAEGPAQSGHTGRQGIRPQHRAADHQDRGHPCDAPERTGRAQGREHPHAARGGIPAGCAPHEGHLGLLHDAGGPCEEQALLLAARQRPPPARGIEESVGLPGAAWRRAHVAGFFGREGILALAPRDACQPLLAQERSIKEPRAAQRVQKHLRIQERSLPALTDIFHECLQEHAAFAVAERVQVGLPVGLW